MLQKQILPDENSIRKPCRFMAASRQIISPEIGTVSLGSVWWIKRDLRLYDNPALTEAASLAWRQNGPLLPLFLFEPSVVGAAEASPFHIQAQSQALADLRGRLIQQHGTDIFVAVQEAVEALEHLYRQHPFAHLVSHQETGTDVTYRRDRAVAAWCKRRGVTWSQPLQAGVFRLLADRDRREGLWHEFMCQAPLAVPNLPPQPPWLREFCAATPSTDAPTSALLEADSGVIERQVATEPLAWATLRGFLTHRASRYSGGISSPVSAFTSGSRLSVPLAWGTISGRAVRFEVFDCLRDISGDTSPEAVKRKRGLRAFSERLHWRDHFAQRLEDEPDLEFHPPHPLYENLPTVAGGEAQHRLAALLAGQTGFPLIDACLRCAATTGFLNFRMRALVTSFACHGLRLDWRGLMAPLGRLWTDYEPGIHVSQVQMQAGVVGINTIRVYSPFKQLKDQDPALIFTRAWLPELAGASDELVLALGSTDGPIHSGYPAPLIDFAAESRIMKDVLYSLRDSPEGKAAAEIVQKRHGSRRPRPARR